jgi:hypothetical protein
MADTKISQLNSGNPAQSGDLVPIARNVAGTQTNFEVTAGSIATLGGGSTTVSVNGTPVVNPNLINGTNTTLSVAGSNVSFNSTGGGGGGVSSLQYGPNTALTGAIVESFGLGMATPSQSGNTVTIACNQATATVVGCATLPAPSSVLLNSYLVSALPSASAVGAGAMAMVTDALTTTVGTCTGGGSTIMLALSSGSVWSCH